MSASHLLKKLKLSGCGDLQREALQGRVPPEKTPHHVLTTKARNVLDPVPQEKRPVSLVETGRCEEEKGMEIAEKD